MAAAARNHDLLWLAAGGAGLFAGYELVVKPWLAAKAAAAAGTSTGLPSLFPSSMISSPTIVPGSGAPTQSSIKDPRVSPGGDVGEIMARKGWSQQQAQARIDALKAAKATALQAISQLQTNTGNPNAAGIAAAQVQLNATITARDNALARKAADEAAGDAAGAAKWAAAAAAQQQDITELQARIAAAGRPLDNSAAIAAYQGALASANADYRALTGHDIP